MILFPQSAIILVFLNIFTNFNNYNFHGHDGLTESSSNKCFRLDFNQYLKQITRNKRKQRDHDVNDKLTTEYEKVYAIHKQLVVFHSEYKPYWPLRNNEQVSYKKIVMIITFFNIIVITEFMQDTNTTIASQIFAIFITRF